MKKLLMSVAVLGAGCMLFSACGGMYDEGGFRGPSYDYITDAEEDNFVHDSIIEKDFTSVSQTATSYFSLDRNTASYSQIRTQIDDGQKVDCDSVRIEEMINYFDYGFAAPTDKSVALTTALSPCPWNKDNNLMLVGLKTTQVEVEDVNANYVFLIDVSGSMSGSTRLPLAKQGFNMLLDGLGDRDVVSIVTYASGVKTVLDGGECTDEGKKKIRSAISSLVASGATSGGDGLERAYKIAQKHFIDGGNNRVILISDGDFNVGMSDTDELHEFIQNKAASGVYLSVIGVGMGNMRDDLLETLATKGNGNYAYLDSAAEARKVFVDELNGTLFTVAKDAKAGVTFTDEVNKYRLIGYDTKLITEDDFNNDKADTGEIGANLCVAALYEIALSANAEGKLAEAEVRYKDVSGDTERNESVTCTVEITTPSSDDLSFISCVAEFGLVLRNSKYKGTASLEAVLTRLNELGAYMADDEYKKEFAGLVGKASESKFYE